MEEKKVPALRFRGFDNAWEQRRLGEVCSSFDYGMNVAAKEFDGENKYIRITDIDDASREFLLRDISSPDICLEREEVSKYLLSNGDIVFARTGASVGKTYIYKKKDGVVYFAGFLIRVKVNKENDADFIFQNTLSVNYNRYITITSQRSGQPGVNAQEYSEYSIFIPLREEQKKIGNYLCNFDHLISLHQRKLEMLKKVKKSMLEKMFPKNDAKVPELRFSDFTDAWEQRHLGEIVERVTRKNENLESTLPLTISAQYGLIDQNEFFDKRIASKDVSGYFLIRRGEFAYNKSTSTDAPWGAIKCLERYENGVLSTLYIVFRIIDEKKLNSNYLAFYYDTDLWHRGVQAIAAEGARNHGLLNIAPVDFFETTLAIPQDIFEQQKIGLFFKQLDHLISLHQRKLEKLKNIKKSMLEKMFII